MNMLGPMDAESDTPINHLPKSHQILLADFSEKSVNPSLYLTFYSF